jgi:hypothetical protein
LVTQSTVELAKSSVEGVLLVDSLVSLNHRPAAPVVTITSRTYNSITACGDAYADVDNVPVGSDPHSATKFYVANAFTGDILTEGEVGANECVEATNLPPYLEPLRFFLAYRDTDGPIYGDYGSSVELCLPGVPDTVPTGEADGPSWLVAAPDCDKYVLSWAALSGMVIYQIWVNLDNTGFNNKIGELPAENLSYQWLKPDYEGTIQFGLRGFDGLEYTKFTYSPVYDVSFHESIWCRLPACTYEASTDSVTLPPADNCIVEDEVFVPDAPLPPSLQLNQAELMATLTISPGG